MTDYILNKIESAFFWLFLHRRERKIDAQFDRRLSQEIDCLRALIEGGK